MYVCGHLLWGPIDVRACASNTLPVRRHSQRQTPFGRNFPGRQRRNSPYEVRTTGGFWKLMPLLPRKSGSSRYDISLEPMGRGELPLSSLPRSESPILAAVGHLVVGPPRSRLLLRLLVRLASCAKYCLRGAKMIDYERRQSRLGRAVCWGAVAAKTREGQYRDTLPPACSRSWQRNASMASNLEPPTGRFRLLGGGSGIRSRLGWGSKRD